MRKRNRRYHYNIHIYVLSLENDCFYIGQSIDISRRVKEHIIGNGSNFTKHNKVISLLESYDTGLKHMINAEIFEDFFTMKYIFKHGHEKVKGGTFLGSAIKRKNRFLFYKKIFCQSLIHPFPPKSFFDQVLKIRRS